MLMLNSSTFLLWPIWSLCVADVVVADMVCGQYGTDPLTHPVLFRATHTIETQIT